MCHAWMACMWVRWCWEQACKTAMHHHGLDDGALLALTIDDGSDTSGVLTTLTSRISGLVRMVLSVLSVPVRRCVY